MTLGTGCGGARMNEVWGYGAQAEFHDLFMEGAWASLEPYVREEFGALDETSLVLDVGAGTGLGVRELGRATQAEIVALEPDLVMRSMLLTQVMADPGLAARTTVVAGRAPTDLGYLPTPADGFLCTYVLGHLTPADRRALFVWLSGSLRPGSTGLVTLSSDDSTARKDVQIRRVGRQEYRAIHRREANGRCETRYEVWLDQRLLRSRTFPWNWVEVTFDDLARDLADLELTAEVLTAGLTRIVRPSGPVVDEVL